jgi:DNA-binding HxlR family transcriptional regulator
VRSYGQYCSLAKALDLIGDRWTILIVRELLLRGACRYTDLRDGLPGIATNLLADRLRELERVGVVEREDAPPPIATTLFRLTPRGEALETALVELGRWGVPLMAEPLASDEFRSHWLALPVHLFLTDRTPEQAPIAIEVRTGGQPIVIETADGGVRTRPSGAGIPDAVLSGTPQLVLGLFRGSLDLHGAEAGGLTYEGDPQVLLRLLGDGLAAPGRMPVEAGVRDRPAGAHALSAQQRA